MLNSIRKIYIGLNNVYVEKGEMCLLFHPFIWGHGNMFRICRE